VSIIGTDKWLMSLYDQPLKVAHKLKPFFEEGTTSEDIYQHLLMNGMYRPVRSGIAAVEKMKEKGLWDMVKKEQLRLKKSWKGPDVPIFIFPSDLTNRQMVKELNGKSGVAFKDKLFLFFSEHNDENEIKALLTHEYNHVCRLSKYKKSEFDYSLLDSIILEGLAENAVREKLGEQYLAFYQSYYSEKQLEQMWEVLIRPNQDIKKDEIRHQQLLYGMGPYPKMAGYCVGYYLVKRILEKRKKKTIELLGLSSEKIINS
jgi:uncharacterized protein YjaZ